MGEILWLFFMLSALQPVLRQKMLEASRLRLLSRMERSRKSRIIALVHRQETMSLLGFPLMKYIDVNDSEEILRAIKLTDADVPIELIVHTPGGLVLAAGQIAHALRRHRAKVTVFVPHYAMSGGTLIALSADEIVMDPNAGSPVGAHVAGAGGGARREAFHGNVDPRLPDHRRGRQVARIADQHRDAGGGVPVHDPLPAAHTHAAVRRVHSGALPDGSGAAPLALARGQARI
jgi:membrane-bound ClpP family serine protease